MSRTRLRWLIVGVALLAMLAATLLAVPALRAAQGTTDRPQNYLALGDSVAFGYTPLVNPHNAANFIGYPTPVAVALKETLTNASCPGEATGGLISLTGTDNSCRTWRFILDFPLHVAYSTSQLDFAVQFLESNPHTQLVTIDIGANDLFVLEFAVCGGPPPPTVPPTDPSFLAFVHCLEGGLPGMLGTLSNNLDTIYGVIRNTASYHHKLVALTYYSLNYSDPFGTGIISQVNQVVADRTLHWGGIVADGFGAFQAASSGFGGDTCAAGLLVVTSVSPRVCNIHPSAAGHGVLAQAIVSAVRSDTTGD